MAFDHDGTLAVNGRVPRDLQSALASSTASFLLFVLFQNRVLALGSVIAAAILSTVLWKQSSVRVFLF